MHTPFISICIPTYKRTDLLKKLLDSIRVQTFKDYEVLINDNSTDNSVELLISTYFKQLPIAYQRNQPSVSAGNNCIQVMQRASGDWVKVMHDDDWFATPDALAQFAEAALHSGKDFIFSANTQVWLEEIKQEEDFLTAEEVQRLDESPFCLFLLNFIGHPSVVMHKRDPSIAYDANFNWLLDIDHYVRYLNAHPGYHYIPQKLVNIGRSPAQETHKYSMVKNAELPEYFRLLSKYEPELYLQNRYVFHLVWNMLKRYRIKNSQQIYDTGYRGVLPAGIDKLITFQKRIPRLIIKQPPWSDAIMRRYFKKMSQKRQQS